MDGFQAGCPPCPPGQDPEYGQGANLGMVHCVSRRERELPDESSSEKDPHLHFAHGGRADFRGKDRQCYNFFSAPGLSVNVRIEVATHVLPSAPGHALTVHGSFITEAHVAALVGPKRRDEPPFPPRPLRPTPPAPCCFRDQYFRGSAWASELNDGNWGWRFVNGTCGDGAGSLHFKLGPGGKRSCADLSIAVHLSSVTFRWPPSWKPLRLCEKPRAVCLPLDRRLAAVCSLTRPSPLASA